MGGGPRERATWGRSTVVYQCYEVYSTFPVVCSSVGGPSSLETMHRTTRTDLMRPSTPKVLRDCDRPHQCRRTSGVTKMFMSVSQRCRYHTNVFPFQPLYFNDFRTDSTVESKRCTRNRTSFTFFPGDRSRAGAAVPHTVYSTVLAVRSYTVFGSGITMRCEHDRDGQ